MCYQDLIGAWFAGVDVTRRGGLPTERGGRCSTSFWLDFQIPSQERREGHNVKKITEEANDRQDGLGVARVKNISSKNQGLREDIFNDGQDIFSDSQWYCSKQVDAALEATFIPH